MQASVFEVFVYMKGSVSNVKQFLGLKKDKSGAFKYSL